MPPAPKTPNENASASAPPKKPPAWLYKRVGRYKLLALLGEGAMGKVFRAEDLQLTRQVALKVISTPPNSNKPLQTVDQALSEARLAAALDHPHIVHVYEVGSSATYSFIAMELVEGGNLKDLVKAGGPMDYVRACQLVAEAAEALAYAHEQGVIHRDVKPANLMLSRGGRCKLADFGLAILQKSKSTNSGHDRPVGTPQFVAPEVIRGSEADARSDVYSLGATLWNLLTGLPPFVAESNFEVLEKQLNEPLPDLAKLRPGLPEGLVRGVTKALEKNPADRFQSAEQFSQLLRVFTIPLGTGGSSAAGLSYVAASGGFRPDGNANQPGRFKKSMLWGGLAALVGTAAMSAAVHWYYGGWSLPTPLPLKPAMIPTPAIIAPPQHKLTSGIIPASDASSLKALAVPVATTQSTTQPATPITVEGVVASNQISKHAKYFRITFIGSDDKTGFVCTYKPELLPALQEKFGGSDGPGLQGKHVRVKGNVEMFKDRPTIRLDTADQIEAVK